MGAGFDIGRDTEPRTTTHDRVPAGEVEIRRSQHVHATNGPIGRVQGLVIDPADHHVTHVLLDEGHLWGQKQVAIPIGSVTGVDDGVRLDLTKDQIRDLPPVELDDQQCPSTGLPTLRRPGKGRHGPAPVPPARTTAPGCRALTDRKK